MRLFFATDVHGSDRCWRKFLAAPSVYGAEVLVMGGDIVGKAIVPISRVGERYEYVLFGERAEVAEEGLADAMARINFSGYYPWVMSEGDAGDTTGDATREDQLFEHVIRCQMQRWAQLATERLPPGVRCVVTAGNDDPQVVDECLRDAARLEFAEGETIEVGPLWLASLGSTNRTPWHTEREYDEPELAEQITALVEPYADGRPLVFNFHCPPAGSGLDTVTELTEDLRPVVRNGHPVEVPAGSSAVRDAIVRFRPTAALHGHIHEGRGAVTIGQTRCFNPGSDYGSGVLKGLLVDFDARGRVRDYLFTTG
jgi:Icc-related predicted phosphoesterase